MKRPEIMLVAGDPSGDANAADLVRALALAVPAAQFKITRDAQPLTAPLAPRFFGAGGPKMAAAGVELAFDLTADSVIGPGGLAHKLPGLMRRFQEVKRLAVERQPELIILVDYGEFNLRLSRALKNYARARAGRFFNWKPKIVQFISPQVWASRPGRAKMIARNCDLLISLFPFERKWYASRVPQLAVEYVGNPIFDRYPEGPPRGVSRAEEAQPPVVLLLPGSRRGELKRHVPVMLAAAQLIVAKQQARFRMVVPNEALAGVARRLLPDGPPRIDLQIGGLKEALLGATVAVAKSGTITMECAFFGVPAVVIYKTDWGTYLVGRWMVNVKYLAMPNLLADEAVYPEFIQGQATAGKISAAVMELLGSRERRDQVRAKLGQIVQMLGGPGAARRAAAAIIKLTGLWNNP